MRLNGSSQYASRAGSATLAAILRTEFTLEAWVYPAAALPTGGGFSVIAEYSGTFPFNTDATRMVFEFVIDANRLGVKYSRASDGADTFVWATGLFFLPSYWYHVALSRKPNVDGTDTISLYRNGIRVNQSITAPRTSGGDTVTFTLGRWVGAANYFNGAIDDVRLSNVARTDAEIAANYTTSMPGSVVNVDESDQGGSGRAKLFNNGLN